MIKKLAELIAKKSYYEGLLEHDFEAACKHLYHYHVLMAKFYDALSRDIESAVMLLDEDSAIGKIDIDIEKLIGGDEHGDSKV